MKRLLLILCLLFPAISFALGPAYGPFTVPFNNIVLVQSLSDLPEPQSGVITLKPLTAYQFDGIIDIGSNRLVSTGDNSIFGKNPFSDTFISTNTGNCISGEDTHFLVQELTLICNSGTLFDFKNTSGNEKTNFFVVQDSLMLAGTKLGNFENMARVAIFISGALPGSSQGFTFSGSDNGEFASHFFATIGTSGTLFNFGNAVFDEINISNSPYVTTGGNIWIAGLANGGNLSSGNIGQITHNSITGGFPPTLTNISKDDEEWNFVFNTGIAPTRPDARDGFTGNSTATTIDTNDGDNGNPKLIAGTWVVNSTSQFTCTTSGRCTYTGVNPMTIPIIVSIKFSVSVGNNKDISFYTAFNGTVRNITEIGNKVDAMDFKSVTLLDQIEFSTGDYIEIWVENNIDTQNVIIEAIHRLIN